MIAPAIVEPRLLVEGRLGRHCVGGGGGGGVTALATAGWGPEVHFGRGVQQEVAWLG